MASATKVRRARGERRRRELLEAALVVIDQRGVQATTHRAVAEAARVPLATTTYYFESIDHLLEDALLLFVSEEAARLRSLAEQLRGVTMAPLEIATLFARELAEGSPWPVPLKRVQWELYLEASRRPRLQAAAQQCVATYAEVTEAALEAAGSPRPAEGARLFVAMTDGLGLHNSFAASGAEHSPEELAGALLELFIPFAMSADEHAAWAARLSAPRGGDAPAAASAERADARTPPAADAPAADTPLP
ncbi:TetR family transcriptional regulator [Conexibacter sp. JD483]|uniref:TetR/AcrR family transcriptional regulator n=1 Tax=unclassified Conexibacter TaxID=2627773 RepID=UPI002715FFA4|nr:MULTISPECIES: TetR family transcriptional regulator [unclassified Conexibacter]MDO8185775.1 TetR family transcriptional regulator [Conexibacter sp. CPCC 205706]MDO8199152.1 TetR family transcriptional regulator [Conexibacter sp. CPCC 205762]MDR9369903.1 TetR family transcriptional regulator [Conexibacter sp. JD483]